MATLHFICGKAGSGKTTLARKLAAQHAAIVFREDEWLSYLDATINNLADYVHHTKRLRTALAPHATELLRRDISIVFDFAGNTSKDRAWVKSIFEAQVPIICCTKLSPRILFAKRDCACATR